MFKCIVVAICIISLCDSSLKSGGYHELVITQHFPISEFFYQYVHLRSVDTTSEKFKNYLEAHRLMFEEQRWVMLGFWAYNSSNHYIRQCVDSNGNELKLNRNLIGPDLRRDLQANWPVLTIDQCEECGWAICYMECGSCITENGTFYLQEGLRLFKDTYVGDILRIANIEPGKDYELWQIVNAVTSALQTFVYVECMVPDYIPEHMKSDVQYLFQITVCYDKNHKLKDCEHRRNNNHYKCDPTKSIMYPVVPPGYL